MDPNVSEALTTLPGANTQDNQDTTPSFAVVKTSPDLTYNLLAKFGMGQVNASGELVTGTEAFHIYEDSGFGSYAHTSALFDGNNLHNYHMIFLPCYASSVGVAPEQVVECHVGCRRRRECVRPEELRVLAHLHREIDEGGDDSQAADEVAEIPERL